MLFLSAKSRSRCIRQCRTEAVCSPCSTGSPRAFSSRSSRTLVNRTGRGSCVPRSSAIASASASPRVCPPTASCSPPLLRTPWVPARANAPAMGSASYASGSSSTTHRGTATRSGRHHSRRPRIATASCSSAPRAAPLPASTSARYAPPSTSIPRPTRRLGPRPRWPAGAAVALSSCRFTGPRSPRPCATRVVLLACRARWSTGAQCAVLPSFGLRRRHPLAATVSSSPSSGPRGDADL
ncbi:hypothetical protein B0H17DRAFT_410759 [Mycena rosella]|uniref:Uncharacterized protein n=1 Tax=Mycena rosella TaxID=1033263 RepID=A0AAD7CLA4_MYCRO|nr:hypothetical protein B0H17DRAFT_410759 [Mycena rosella]